MMYTFTFTFCFVHSWFSHFTHHKYQQSNPNYPISIQKLQYLFELKKQNFFSWIELHYSWTVFFSIQMNSNASAHRSNRKKVNKTHSDFQCFAFLFKCVILIRFVGQSFWIPHVYKLHLSDFDFGKFQNAGRKKT